MARKKKGLPFLVQPRLAPVMTEVGNEESGILEIERRGYLNVAEKSYTQSIAASDDSVTAMQRFLTKVARETGMEHNEVLQALGQAEIPANLLAYEEDFTKIANNMTAFQSQYQLVAAQSLIVSRLDPEWTIEQTMDLHPDLIADLHQLYQEEEAKILDELEQAAEESGEGK